MQPDRDESSPVRVPDDVAELVEGGVVIEVATRDDRLLPESSFGFGARLDPGRSALTVYVPDAGLGRTLDNARANGAVAVVFGRPSDHASVQIKGTFLGARTSGEADRAVQERYRGAVVEQLAGVGVPRSVSRRLTFWPSTAIDVEVREIYLQTPGPGAGRRLP